MELEGGVLLFPHNSILIFMFYFVKFMTVVSFHPYLLKKLILNCHCSYFPSLKVQGACKSVLSVTVAGTVCRHSCCGRQQTTSHALSWKGRMTSKLEVWQAMSNNSAIACLMSSFLLLSSNILCTLSWIDCHAPAQ